MDLCQATILIDDSGRIFKSSLQLGLQRQEVPLIQKCWKNFTTEIETGLNYGVTFVENKLETLLTEREEYTFLL